VPVTEDQFCRGRSDIELAVLWFMRKTFDLAYAAEEVLFELGATGILSTPDEIDRALAHLLSRERIESNVVHGAVYYKYYRRLGFRPQSI
jgi:hypothetical protein